MFPPKYFAELSGQGNDAIMAAIRSGELEAIDLSSPNSSRPKWAISMEAWEAYLTSRSSLHRFGEGATTPNYRLNIEEFV